MRKRIVIPLIIIAVAILAGAWWEYSKIAPDTASYSRQQTLPPANNPATPSAPDAPSNGQLPKTLVLKVPFTPQAPTGNWDQLHNEACEEASSLMAGLYFGGDTNNTIPAGQVEAEISKLVNWENQTYGYSLDTTSAETAKMVEQVYGLKTKLLDDFSMDDLKTQLNQGHVVLVSEDGRLLHNPNYKRPGPPHHMLVIKGYDSQGIITNDSGTKNGRNYFYDFATVHDAAGDWDHGKSAVDLSRKVAIVVWKE